MSAPISGCAVNMMTPAVTMATTPDPQRLGWSHRERGHCERSYPGGRTRGTLAFAALPLAAD